MKKKSRVRAGRALQAASPEPSAGRAKNAPKNKPRARKTLWSDPIVPLAFGGMLASALGKTLGNIFPRNDQIKLEIKSEKVKDEVTLNLDGVSITIKPMPPKGESRMRGFPDRAIGDSDGIRADTLVAEVGAKKLIGRWVRTQRYGDYPGGLARITEVAPDPKATEIVFVVFNPHWIHEDFPDQTIGVFDYEIVCLIESSMALACPGCDVRLIPENNGKAAA